MVCLPRCPVVQCISPLHGLVVISGDEVCWNSDFGTLVGVSVFSDMWSEFLMTSAISCPRWSSVYECQGEE